jgi:HAD superfamily hydrolase (TIGR01450 family)
VDRLRKIKHLALDLDGTLYLGKRLFPFTLDFLRRVREMSIGRTFFTNNSSVSTSGYVAKLRKLGIDAEEGDVYSSTTATLAYLRHECPGVKRIFVLGTPALRQEFADAGLVLCEEPGQAATDPPDAVVVGFDTTLEYARLCRAAYWIAQGKPFIATHCDAVCPTDEATVLPDCGAICKLLTHATGREPDAVLGKPSPAMLGGMMRRHDLRPEQVAVVGDRLYTDVAMGQAAGAVSVLVLSGETTRAQADAAARPPDFVVENVAALADLLDRAHRSLPCPA